MSYNFPDHIKGDTFDGLDFVIKLDNLPLNLVGATINMDLRATATGDSVKRFSTTSAEFVITDGAAGKFQFKEQIVDVALAGNYYYDIEIILLGGYTKTWISGKWKIKQDITHV